MVFKIRFRWVFQNSSFGKWGVCMKTVFKIQCFKQGDNILHSESGKWYSKYIVLDGAIKIFIWKVGSLHGHGIQNSLF